MILCRDPYWDIRYGRDRGWVSHIIQDEVWDVRRTTDGTRYRLVNSQKWSSHLIFQDTLILIMRTARGQR